MLEKGNREDILVKRLSQMRFWVNRNSRQTHREAGKAVTAGSQMLEQGIVGDYLGV